MRLSVLFRRLFKKDDNTKLLKSSLLIILRNSCKRLRI